MSTIGIWDADYMRYESVIPNLECAKLCTYFHSQREIAVLVPELRPEQYTRFFIRKDYEDGIYPKKMFEYNCEYGGRAFTPDKYKPLPPQIEKVIPNMHIYDKYVQKFGNNKSSLAQIKRILNCAHIRLSTDEVTPKSLAQLKRILATGKYTGIIFHDYDLAKIKNAYDIIYDLSNTRTFVTKQGINPYAIGNKFPIQIFSSEELEKWLKIVAMPNIFFLQFNGVMDDKTLFYLCLDNKRMAKQVYYNITASSSSENDFFLNVLPKIFIQVLFLRRANIKILLKYDEKIIVTPEIKNFIELLNCWLSFSWQEDFLPLSQTLYAFCRTNKKLHYKSWAFLTVSVPVESIRDSFQYIREKNYDFFKMFYEWDTVNFNKEIGGFVNDR